MSKTFPYNGHAIDIRKNGKFIELWINGKFATSHRQADNVSRETVHAKFLRTIQQICK